jgi:RND family efflux transporter MFP subunit
MIMNILTNKQRAARYAVVLFAATLAACGRGAQETTAPPTPVRTAVAVSGPASPPIEGNGIVATKDEARLSFKVGGVVSHIRVQDGESVRKGQLLAEIEPAEINAQVDASWQLAEKARRDAERGERLYADQVISLEQLEGLRTQAATSRAQLRSVQFNRGYATIVAPRDGVVLRKLVQERELVPAGQPVLALGGRERGYIVRGALADREIVQVKIGDLAKVGLDAWPGKEFLGHISEVASAADERSGMFPIEVKLDAAPVQLVTGLVAKLRIQPASASNGRLVYVPISAVLEGDGNQATVFLVAGDKAQKRRVRVAFLTGDQAALSEGLRTGDVVITEGALYLVDGETIRVAAGSNSLAHLRS